MADRQALTPFIIGLHGRGEDWTAHDLGLLLNELELPVADKDDLVAYVNDAMLLLDAYDRVRWTDAGAAVEDDDDDGAVEDDDELRQADGERPGWLII